MFESCGIPNGKLWNIFLVLRAAKAVFVRFFALFSDMTLRAAISADFSNGFNILLHRQKLLHTKFSAFESLYHLFNFKGENVVCFNSL